MKYVLYLLPKIAHSPINSAPTSQTASNTMDSPFDGLQTPRENPLLLERDEPSRAVIDIRIPIDPDNKGYWEKELVESMKPNWTHLSLTVHKEPMDILARSRSGEYMVIPVLLSKLLPFLIVWIKKINF